MIKIQQIISYHFKYDFKGKAKKLLNKHNSNLVWPAGEEFIFPELRFIFPVLHQFYMLHNKTVGTII